MHRRPLAASHEELNLIPIMNLVTLLIPFLLMSAQFVSYAVIDSHLPAICGPPCTASSPEEPVEVRLELTRSGYRLHATGPGLAAEDAEVVLPCPTDRCADGAEHAWDVDGLRRALTRIKDAHPEHHSIVLSVQDGIAYEAVVLAMDATREDPSQGGLSGGACTGRCLFPHVTLAGAP